jgi:DHA1 family bicyclomycin/chloramphenicol resistance-like MFS transporter
VSAPPTTSARRPAPPAAASPPPSPDGHGSLGPAERIALLAFTMSLTALGIDLLLPAFPEVRASLGLAADSNATAGLITTYFLGLAVGQIGFGVLADGRGRRRTLYLGFAIYGFGALASVFAPTLPALLVTRFIWGLGGAAGRVVTLAVVRDTWSGDRMSRAMSFVMAVFILVPVVSPAVGASLLTVVSWRWLLVVCAAAAAGVAVWALRLPETLRPENRRSMRPRRVAQAARMAVQQPATVGGGLGMMLLFGAFTSWIGSAELIIEDVFGLGSLFPVIFGGLASVLGVGMLVNARIVGRFGTRRVTRVTLVGYLVVAALFAGVAVVTDGTPPFPLFAAGLGLLLGAHALLAPNVNAIAMEPVGHIAGTASALIGTVQVAGGAALGAIIDRLYDGTVLPLALGFLVYGIAGAMVIVRGLRDLEARQPVTTDGVATQPA